MNRAADEYQGHDGGSSGAEPAIVGSRFIDPCRMPSGNECAWTVGTELVAARFWSKEARDPLALYNTLMHSEFNRHLFIVGCKDADGRYIPWKRRSVCVCVCVCGVCDIIQMS